MHIEDTKKELRDAVSERLDHLPKDQREAESKSLCRRLLEEIPEGASVLAYWALKTEPNLRHLIDTFLERGHKIYLPCFVDFRTECRELRSIDELQKGSINIYEPPTNAPVLPREKLDIALLPGRAFDKTGMRLGRGNGGYDHWIRKQRATNPETIIWGVAYECQIFPEVPFEDHDERVDRVITARGFLEY